MKNVYKLGAAAVLLSWIILEIVLDFIHYRPRILYRGEDPPLSIHLDPKVLYSIDSAPPAASSGKPRLLFLGDEVALPLGGMLQKNLAPQFDLINLATRGYGPDQWLFRMAQDLNGLRGDAIVLLINAGNDFEDLDKNEMFYVKNHATVHPSRVNVVQKLLPPLKTQMFFRQVFLGQAVSPETENTLVEVLLKDNPQILTTDAPSLKKTMLMHHVIAEFQRFAQNHERSFLIVILPSAQSLLNKNLELKKRFLNEVIIEHLCKSYNIPALNLTSDLMEKPERFFQMPQKKVFNSTAQHLITTNIESFLKTHLVAK